MTELVEVRLQLDDNVNRLAFSAAALLDQLRPDELLKVDREFGCECEAVQEWESKRRAEERRAAKLADQRRENFRRAAERENWEFEPATTC